MFGISHEKILQKLDRLMISGKNSNSFLPEKFANAVILFARVSSEQQMEISKKVELHPAGKHGFGVNLREDNKKIPFIVL